MDMCETIKGRNQAVWDRMQTHRFVEDVVADRLDPAVFRRYLAFEGAFVETAISIFGHALLQAPDMARKRYLIGTLRSLALDQVRYFEETKAALGIAVEPPPTAAVRAFDRGMLEIARNGSFGQIMTAMLAAEWMYFTWCSRAARTPSRDPILRRWIDLHVDNVFSQGVVWLKEQVQEFVPSEGIGEAVAVFGRVLELEIAFHDAPYDA